VNKRLWIFCTVFPLVLLFQTSSFAVQHRVIRIVDGDTIVVNYQGNNEKVRLLCVNTPESVHRDKKQNIPLGKVASEYTEKRLSRKFVDLEFEGAFRGRYGRLLAYVIVDGKNFNVELVEQGLSPYYTKYGKSQKYDKQFKEAEKHARKNRLHIWWDPELTEKYLRLKSKWGQNRSEVERAPPVKAPGQSGYVASKKSKAFHRPECRWVKKISPGNLIGFSGRGEAVGSGRRPCKTCSP